MSTLYRKYRPQSFKEIVGQNHIKLTLEHEVETGNTAHAYLFCGPRAVGKTTLARVLAKALNCTGRKTGEHDPCNECDNCRDITDGRSLDVLEIDAASHTGVDNVRENVIVSARTAPSSCRYKVFIIDEVHMLSLSAFNALLKIIEEPPEFVLFILCTTEVHKVPATIISRCQRFDFKKISISDIAKKLAFIAKSENIEIDKEILEAIARQSEGHMRDAESLLGQVVAIGGKRITKEEADLVIPRSDLFEAADLIALLAKKDAGGAIALFNRLNDDGISLPRFTADLTELLRKMMLAKINPALAEKLGLELGESLELKINSLLKELDLNRIIAYINRFSRARQELKSSFIVQLPLELAAVELCTGTGSVNTEPAVVPPVFSFPSAAGKPSGASAPRFTVPANPSRPASQPLNTGPAKQASAPPSAGDKAPGHMISREEIIEHWQEVLVKIKKYNHSLSFILRVCQPREVNGSKLCLAFKYKFHKDRIGDVNVKQMVEQVLKEVYNSPLSVDAIVDETLEVSNNTEEAVPRPAAENEQNQAPANPASPEADASKQEGDDMINNLLKTFGGKVVK